MDHIDASVAPPRLTTVALGASSRMRSGMEGGIQSPESMTKRSFGNVVPSPSASIVSSKSCMSAGAEFHTVTPSVIICAGHAVGFLRSAGAG